jgi:hypothetical protein
MAQADAAQKLGGEHGAAAKPRLSNPASTGQPEDQLRNPLETLFAGLAAVASDKDVALFGESSLADLKTRPDSSVPADKSLIGFMEVKALGKGANNRRNSAIEVGSPPTWLRSCSDIFHSLNHFG